MAEHRRKNTGSFWGTGMTTTISITLVLLLLGLTILLGFMGKSITSFVKENLTVTIELPDKMKESDILKMENTLQKASFVKEVKFVSKEQIKQQLIEDLGRDPEEVLGYNPASSCFEIKLKSEYANSDSVKVVEKKLKDKNLAQEILYSEDDLNMVNANLSKVSTIMLVFALILMFISFTLIRNTIRLNIYSKRFIISTMQLVGATNAFIRKPFIQRAVVWGIIASILANVIITVILYSLSKEYRELISLISMNDLCIIYVAVLLLGVLLTFTATYFSVNKYLKMNTNNLYNI
ncbi:MAG: cell division protein FtsX [Dysgonomonas sp.]